MKLSQIQKSFERIANKLAPGSSAKISTEPLKTGGAYAEFDGSTYRYIVEERGEVFETRETTDPDELLYWFVTDFAFDLATEWELRNRIVDQDPRRLLFQRQIDLLRSINSAWAKKTESWQNEKLMRRPFRDERFK